MKTWILSDFVGIGLTSILYYLVSIPANLDLQAEVTIYPGLLIVFLIDVYDFVVGFNILKGLRLNFFNSIAMFAVILIMYGELFGRVLGIRGPWSSILFGYYITLFLFSLLLFLNTMGKVENGPITFATIILFAIAMIAHFLVVLIDLLFPPRIQELIPYISAVKEFIENTSNIMANPERLKAEAALKNLGDLSSSVTEVGENFAIRKGVGSGIDFGITALVLALGVFTYFINLGIPPGILFLLFGSLGVALATFSGFFGPFYGMAQSSKTYLLHNGNYRGATIFKTIEELFAIPFLATSAGFYLVFLPPVDSQSLDDFKTEVQEQLTQISDSVNSLIGKSQSTVPRKTRKMIADMMTSTKQNLNKLDFREVREESAREFALAYYQHEFSWNPLRRKMAVKEFAAMNHFDLQTAESTLKLIGIKIQNGQMDDDMVSNVMITAAMRGVIQMEEKYQSMLSSLELGQTCIGLAFGARQFLKDHYVIRTRKERTKSLLKNLYLGIIALPSILISGLHKYTNEVFDNLGPSFWHQEIAALSQVRYNEIYQGMLEVPAKVFRKKSKSEKKERKLERRRKFKINLNIWLRKLLIVIIFPFKLLWGSMRWVYGKILPKELDPKKAFEQAISHTALVSMYNELYRKLVLQENIFMEGS